MATLVKTVYGSYVGPGSKFRVVAQIYAEDKGNGYKLTLRRYVQVVAGTSGFQGTILTINWGSGSVNLYKDNNYAVTDTDLGTYGYGKTYSLNGIEAYYTGSSTYTSTTNISYTVPTPTYTISYNMNGGSGTIESQKKTYGKDLKLSEVIPTMTGHNFVYWNTKQDGTGDSYAAGDVYEANTGATLYAQYEPYTHTIVYNGNGGTGVPSNQVKKYGSTIDLSTKIPTRSGYKFIIWNTKADGTGLNLSPGQTYGLDQNGGTMILYAQWKEEGAAFLNQDEKILKGKMILNDDGDQMTGIPLMKINGAWKKGGA